MQVWVNFVLKEEEEEIGSLLLRQSETRIQILDGLCCRELD